MNRIQSLLANKHTSGAALLYIVASALEVLGPLWFPGHKHEFETTSKWLEKTALVYGFAAATDSSQLGQVKADVGNVKEDVKQIKTGNTDQFPNLKSQTEIKP